jgi:hypothetical protein
MLAANASLVLGYLWVGWLSDGSQSGTALELARGGVLPVIVAVAIFGLRPACARRALPGGSVLLPVAATIELGAAIAADASGAHFLAVAAGAAALLVALLSIACVLLREVGAVKRWSATNALRALRTPSGGDRLWTSLSQPRSISRT